MGVEPTVNVSFVSDRQTNHIIGEGIICSETNLPTMTYHISATNLPTMPHVHWTIISIVCS